MKPTFDEIKFENAPFEIIDGDRGGNYPKGNEFSEIGYCLFLNAGNVTTSGFSLEQCSFITEVKDNLLRKGKLKRNDIILTTRGTVGNVAFYDTNIPYEHIRINSGMVIFRANPDEILPKYLYAFLRSNYFMRQVLSLRSGSAQPQLPIRDMRKIKIPIPSILEQERIVDIIYCLDDKIELNRRMNETLEAIAQALFKAWFVDFEPVRANMENRPSESASPEIAKLFPSEFENGIPKGWEETNFGAIVREENQRNKEKRNLPVLSAIQTGELVKSAEFFNKQVFSAETAKYKLVKILSYAFNPSRINIGSIGMNNFEEVGLVSPVYVVFSVKPEFAHWVRFHIRSKRVKNLVNVLSTGTVRQNLTFKDFSSIPLILPTIEAIRAFDQPLSSIKNLKREKISEIDRLKQIRDSLLPRLISGKIRVGAMESFSMSL